MAPLCTYYNSGEYIATMHNLQYMPLCIILKILQTFYIDNNYSLLGDDQAIAQQLIYDILTCFAADVLDMAPLAAEKHHDRGASCRPYGGRQAVPHQGAP